MGKSIFASKVFWANIIALLAAVGSAYGLDVSPETQAELVGGIMAAMNIGLRLLTNQPAYLIAPPTLRGKPR